MIMRSVVARGIPHGMLYEIFRGIMCFALLLALRVHSSAQTPEFAPETSQKSSKTAPSNTIFVEILDNGGLYSLNYERRLLLELNVRIGASYYGESIDLG